MPTTASFRHMKLHVKSQIVMYVNYKPSIHINLRDLFTYLLHLFIALIYCTYLLHLFIALIYCTYLLH